MTCSKPAPVLGILAGSGDLPKRIIQVCNENNRQFFVIAFNDQTPPEILNSGDGSLVPHAWVRLGAAGKALALLRRAGVQELVMAGAIRRPSLAALRPDKWAAKFFARSGVAALGDDNLLSALVGDIEDEGFKVVGADSLLDDLLATEGIYGVIQADKQNLADIAKGIAAAHAIGSQDIGQGAVVCNGEVIALEDAYGTDAMLANCKGKATGGVLVKVSKPGQERRSDLPAIGVTTVKNATDAGLDGIAIEAGGALIIDRKAVIKAADAAGLFVIGMNIADMARPPLIYLIAGEPSGDALAARLMAALKRQTSGHVRFAGVGGPLMQAEGLVSIFAMSELSLMGLSEIIPHIPRLLRRIDECVENISQLKPAALLTIDSPGFNFRVAKRLKGHGVPIIHYVAPSVWAWRPGRARKVAKFLDHLLALLPFEPPYFTSEGLPCTFVGHSVLESAAGDGDGKDFRRRHGISAEATLLAVLPGSRRSEIANLLPVFGETVSLLGRSKADIKVVVPVVAAMKDDIVAAVAKWPITVQIVEGEAEKFNAFAAADVALAASGTVALELAMAKTPNIIAYKMQPLTAWLARRLIRLPFVNLVNIILERQVVPEFLQNDCRPALLAVALEKLLDDKDARRRQIAQSSIALESLGSGGALPSDRAAEVVLKVIEGKKQ